MKKNITLCLLSLLITACTTVKLTAEGEKARVLTKDEVTKCQYLGKTTSTTTDKVVGVKRHQIIINNELKMLARNAAHKLDGDTVVAESEEVDGRQSFLIYRCVPQ